MTTIYLIRHSEAFRTLQGEFKTNDSVQLLNEKSPLSVKGEELAKTIASKEEFKSIDVVWTSNYVRAISTAKYFAVNNNLKVNIDDRLGERIQGIKSWDKLPAHFEKKQMEDENYKIGYGESQLEVRKRMEEVFNEILNNNINKRIAIIGHSTAITFLLKKWCKIEYGKPYKFNGLDFFDGNWNYCETFKLLFDENKELISVEDIKNL